MTASEVALLDAIGQAELVRRGDVSPAELVGWAIERIEQLNPRLNAVVTPMFDHAVEAARSVAAGPLSGVPYLLKDLAVEASGVRFTEGSRFLQDNVSHYDSELVVRLRRAGLVVVGKTNTPEFGMAPACEPLLFGPTRNPWDLERSTSGSSGGSAAAVAAGLVPAAHANDLGGSIRYPASACGLFGLKPTRARNPFGPEYGDVVSGWAVEHAVTRSVRDSAAILDATAGPDVGDPYRAPAPERPFLSEVGADPGRLRIGFTPRTPDGSLGHPDCVAALDDAVRLCTELGHEMIELDLPGLDGATGAAIGTVFNAATAWIVGYWVRRVGRAPAPGELEPLTRAFWEMGRGITAADYLLAIEDLQVFARTRGPLPHRRRPLAHAHAGDAAVAVGRDGLDRRRAAAGARKERADRRLRRGRGQHHGQPGDVGAPVVERGRPADRGALPRPLRRRGDAPAPRRPARAGPPLGDAPTAGARIGVTRRRARREIRA